MILCFDQIYPRVTSKKTHHTIFHRLINDEDRLKFFELVKSCSQAAFKVDLAKILFPHVLGGSSVVEDEHLRTLCFGDYMHPEVDKRTYDEIPDLSLLTKGTQSLSN